MTSNPYASRLPVVTDESVTRRKLFDYGLMQKKIEQVRSSNSGGSADHITGPMPNLVQYEIVDGVTTYKKQRENHGHGNNGIGIDFTNPGAAFGFVDPPPFVDSYIYLSWGEEILPAPGASNSINLIANVSGNDGGYDNSGFLITIHPLPRPPQ